MAMEYGWSDLPEDLLHLVYAKLVGSMLQRVRFAAVCTSWRDAAIVSRRAAPPAAASIPWHISAFGGRHDRKARVYCPEDDEAFTVRLPCKAEVSQFLGAHDGGWIAALTRRHAKLVVFNLFSGVEVPLSVFAPTWHRRRIRKIVFSKEPTSSDCILAALTSSPGVVALCPENNDSWIMAREEGSRFDDIAFHNGKLYGLAVDKDVFRFDIITKEDDGATSVVATTRFAIIKHASPAYIHYQPSLDLKNTKNRNHLLVLDGNLAMARTWWYSNNMPPLVDVSQLTRDHQRATLNWTEATSLGENALFLGETCSISVRLPPAGGRSRVERNCIYTTNALYLDDGGRMYYNVLDQKEKRIKVVHASQDGMWLIPPCV